MREPQFIITSRRNPLEMLCRHFLDKPSVPPASAGGGRRPRGKRRGLHLRGGSDAEEQAEGAQDGSQPLHHRIRHLRGVLASLATVAQTVDNDSEYSYSM